MPDPGSRLRREAVFLAVGVALAAFFFLVL